MTSSLVGSEMCIRDRKSRKQKGKASKSKWSQLLGEAVDKICALVVLVSTCLLYTSDAADDM
eukprot:4571667-Prorocentrum_lima.AAC.1